MQHTDSSLAPYCACRLPSRQNENLKCESKEGPRHAGGYRYSNHSDLWGADLCILYLLGPYSIFSAVG